MESAVRRAWLESPTIAHAPKTPPLLEQEPDAPLGLLDPVFQQTCGGDVAILVAKAEEIVHA